MTYDDNLLEKEMTGTPELYHFWSGNEDAYVTSWYEDLQFAGNIYFARPIKRGGFSIDQTFGAVTMIITAPLLAQFIAYVSSQPIEPTRIKLYRAISDDLTDFKVIFTGTLRRMGISDRIAKAEFESKARQLRVRLPKFLYQSYCNWDVFDSDCGLAEFTYTVSTAVTVSNDTLVSSVFAGYAADYFTAGRVKYEGDERWILDHTADTLTLQVPFGSEVETGTVVDVLPGCDGNPDTCKDTYSNFKNFFGFPYVPSNNPCLFGFK